MNAGREAGLDVLVVDPRKPDLNKIGKKAERREAREIARRPWLGELDRMARTYYPSDFEYGRRKLLRVRHRPGRCEHERPDRAGACRVILVRAV